MNSVVADMPKYQCHKVVHALKIIGLHIDETEILLCFHAETDDDVASIRIPVEEDEHSRFIKASGADFGYYVVYEDGYISWSPSKAFEDGYTRLPA